MWILIVIWVLGVVIFIRGAQLTQAAKKRKLFKNESTLFYQKTMAIVFVLMAVIALITSQRFFAYAAAINLLITAMFYLQPTPRTTRNLFYGFAIINSILISTIVF